jgi:GNAT superfamily N-acetyltransferase
MTIRPVQLSDAAAVAKLSGELGYPVSCDAMESRIRFVQACSDRAALVACVEDEVVGWIDVAIAHHLQSGPYVEIGGLVVSSSVRSRGIGAELVAAAEKWALDRGVPEVLVRSQIAREAAHRFYERLGYSRAKTSAVFRKTLVS